MSNAGLTMQELDELIREERAAITAMIDDLLLPLMVRRRLLVIAGTRAPPAPIRNPVTHSPKAVPMAKKDERTRRKTGPTAISLLPLSERMRTGTKRTLSKVVMAALETAPEVGLHGKVLNKIILENGYSLDAAEKTKTRLGHLGGVRFDVKTGFWSLTDEYRRTIPRSRPIKLVTEGLPENRAKSPAEQTAGRIILAALREGPAGGMPSTVLVAKVIEAGHSRSLAKHAFGALSLSGLIQPASDGTKIRWWKMGPKQIDADLDHG